MTSYEVRTLWRHRGYKGSHTNSNTLTLYTSMFILTSLFNSLEVACLNDKYIRGSWIYSHRADYIIRTLVGLIKNWKAFLRKIFFV